MVERRNWSLITKNEENIMKVNWQGVYPAVTTQYNDDLSINFEATTQMVDTIINEGVNGIIALGTVGENASPLP